MTFEATFRAIKNSSRCGSWCLCGNTKAPATQLDTNPSTFVVPTGAFSFVLSTGSSSRRTQSFSGKLPLDVTVYICDPFEVLQRRPIKKKCDAYTTVGASFYSCISRKFSAMSTRHSISGTVFFLLCRTVVNGGWDKNLYFSCACRPHSFSAAK